MTDIMDRKRELISAVEARLEALFSAAAESGVDPEVYADTDTIATAMVAAVPAHNAMDRIVGPFYDTSGLTEWLGISKQALAKRAAAGSIVACRLSDSRGTWVYPTWQFTADGTVLETLPEIWRELRDAADPWTAALWLCAPSDDLGGASAVDHLRSGGEPSDVLVNARAAATRWAE